MTLGISNTKNEYLLQQLEQNVDGEVRFDKMSRILYSTDASMYQIEPIGVVLPRSEEDIVAITEIANQHGVPILPRGGGTSLAGQAVGHAIVIDFSKYMRKVLEVNTEEGWVRTQPGIILDELNAQLRSHNVHFAPDPSTSNRGNVGGALGNNSCGAHSVIYGKTVDNVREVRAVLSNGNVATLGLMEGESLKSKCHGDSLESQIYKKLVAIGHSHNSEISDRFPTIQRRVSGYNLDELLTTGTIDTARFIVGSEGTLVSVTEAKLKVVSLPKYKVLSVLHFHELMESMEATVLALTLEPAAVELIDNMIIKQARENLEYSRLSDFIEGEPEAILLVEFSGDSLKELEEKLDRLDYELNKNKMSYANLRVIDTKDQAKVWAIRKAGLGLMMNVQGPAKPLPFVEDTAVSPEMLPEYVRRFDEIIRDHGTTAGYYGHASVGCLHIRPLINLKDTEDVNKMVSIAEQISDLVLEFGGAMSGEHGDGLARSGWNEKMFGSRIYQVFREVKQIFDPDNIMNPGKIVDAPPMSANLRTDPGTNSLNIETGLDFRKQGNMSGAAEMCNGQGACRKLSGTMCPSYMITRDEEQSTRGRANALRAATTGTLPVDTLTSSRLYEVMDLCLGCKGCKAECPSNVDMAKLKFEFLDRYHTTNGYSLRNRIFANISALGRLGSFMAPFSNWTLESQPFKLLLEQIAGIESRRTLPSFASQTFTQWFKSRPPQLQENQFQNVVILFPDTFTNYNYPNLGQSAVKFFEHIGYRVIVPETHCCGRPMLSNGMLNKARKHAQFNVETLYPLVKHGAKIVGLEPSCILTFRDEYLDLLDKNPQAKLVAENSMLVEEFVKHAVEKEEILLDLSSYKSKLLFHGHCHQKALVGSEAAIEILELLPRTQVEEIQSGCCGMAGSFGFEKDHYEASLKIGEQSLFGPIRSAGTDVQLVSEGVSCRQQIQDGTGMKAKHLIEILAESI